MPEFDQDKSINKWDKKIRSNRPISNKDLFYLCKDIIYLKACPQDLQMPFTEIHLEIADKDLYIEYFQPNHPDLPDTIQIDCQTDRYSQEHWQIDYIVLEKGKRRFNIRYESPIANSLLTENYPLAPDLDENLPLRIIELKPFQRKIMAKNLWLASQETPDLDV